MNQKTAEKRKRTGGRPTVLALNKTSSCPALSDSNQGPLRTPSPPPKAESSDDVAVTDVSPEPSSSKKKRRRRRRMKAIHRQEDAPSSPIPQVAPESPGGGSNQSQGDYKKKLSHAQVGFYRRRARKREEPGLPRNPAELKLCPAVTRKDVETVQTDFSLADLAWAKGAFIGRRERVVESVSSLDELGEEGFRVMEWDGRYVSLSVLLLFLTGFTRTPHVITSNEGKIFTALPGRPVDDPTWDVTTKGVEAAMAKAESKLKFGKRRDRRGPFNTIASGVSYGGGQKVSALSTL